MTIHSFTAGTLHSGFNLAEPVMSFVDAFSARLAARRRYRTVRAELEDYAPEQLAELGISDADIDLVAEEAARRADRRDITRATSASPTRTNEEETMGSQFRIRDGIPIDQVPGASAAGSAIRRRPAPAQITALDANLSPGQGHGFHKHPDQEEVLCVIEGEIEQWVDREKRILKAGDAIFIAPGMVHATFNVGKQDARFIVFFSPCGATASRPSTCPARRRGRASRS